MFSDGLPHFLVHLVGVEQHAGTCLVGQDHINSVSRAPRMTNIVSGDVDWVNVVMVPIQQVDHLQSQFLR